jgi:Rrf2 family protein
MARQTNLQFAVIVHVLTYLAGMGDARPISSDELSASTNANPVYIRRALGPLREAGLIRSLPGAKGGWKLAQEPQDVTLADVWRIVQGEEPVLGLHGANPACPVGREITAALHDIDRDLAHAMEAELEGTTIADLLTPALEKALN